MDWNARLGLGSEAPKTRPPLLSLFLAYVAMLPLAAGALAAGVLRGRVDALVIHLTVVWAGALLCFFAGVHRGLSFRQPGGPVVRQLGGMLLLFCMGVVSLLSPWPGPALVLQLAGFASMAVLDPIAARHGEAPRYFARLRPVQLAVPLASLGLVLWCVISRRIMQ